MLENLRRRFTYSVDEDFYNSRCNLGKFHELTYYNGFGYSSKFRCSKVYGKGSFRQIHEIMGDIILKGVTFKMISCPRGIFIMGQEDEADNQPRPEMIVTPFLLGEAEVTQELYEAVMGSNSSECSNKSQNPVENVSWYDAVEFCNKLSELQGIEKCYTISNKSTIDKHGRDSKRTMTADVVWNMSANGYRLPTEKEWEYAAKAGTRNRWSGTDDEDIEVLDLYARYEENSSAPMPVKWGRPNGWGFFDMSGNVYEWCWDIFAYGRSKLEENRVIRGGCFRSDTDEIKVARRHRDLTYGQAILVGFRLCRTFF